VPTEHSGPARPPSVTGAALLFVLYGVAAVVNAAAMQNWSGVEAGSIPRAVLRLAAAGLVAWGLLRGAGWSWWMALALAILWLVSGLAPVVVLERGDMHWLPPSGDQIFLAVSLVSLSIAILLLLTPSARAHLRRDLP
jgi:hypothetical protein